MTRRGSFSPAAHSARCSMRERDARSQTRMDVRFRRAQSLWAAVTLSLCADASFEPECETHTRMQIRRPQRERYIENAQKWAKYDSEDETVEKGKVNLFEFDERYTLD